ncbi:MAG: hypothetical protein WCB99_01775 [Candidatus Cybelea sp.]|jgi:hypothetical protein
MNISSLAKYAIGLTTAGAMLAACSSGGSTMSPTTGSGFNTDAAHLGTPMIHGVLITAEHPNLNGAIAPDKKKHHKKKKPDEYMSNFYGGDLLEFDYPKADASIGTVSNLTDPQGECTGVTSGIGKGSFWVVESGTDTVDQFKLGGTSPVASLSVTAGEPAGCAIDPKTGNLAVSVLSTGAVIVFAGAKGSGTSFSSGLVEAYFVGYDNKGNLFVDGKNSSSEFGMAELASGAKSFTPIAPSNSITFPGGVQFDGKFVTVNDQENHVIDQYTISGSKATLAGSVSLSGSGDCVQTWIGKGDVFCADATNEDGEVYKYPAGGSAIATLTGSFDLPIGAVEIEK